MSVSIIILKEHVISVCSLFNSHASFVYNLHFHANPHGVDYIRITEISIDLKLCRECVCYVSNLLVKDVQMVASFAQFVAYIKIGTGGVVW